jgi:hypothetical protein
MIHDCGYSIQEKVMPYWLVVVHGEVGVFATRIKESCGMNILV